MKILISLSYYSPYKSGLTLAVQNLAETLKKMLHRVTVITVQYDKKLPQSDTFNGVKIKRVPFLFTISKGFFMPSYPIRILQLIRDTDVAMIHLPQVEGIVVAMLAKLLNKRLYCFYYCDVVLSKGFFSRLIEKILDISSFISLSLSDLVITLTQDYAENSRVLPQFKHKLFYIYPLIRIPKKNTSAVKELIRKLPRNAPYRIGLLSRIASEKGIEYLLESIPFIQSQFKKDFLILIAGSTYAAGEEKYLQKIKNLIKKYKRHIVFLGTLSDEEKDSFYSLLDVFVLPSVNSTEAFGMVQIEAMLCGVPVVATDLPGVRVPIKKTGMGVLVQPKDSKKIADAIIKVLSSKKDYVVPRKEILREFSPQNVLKKYLEVLN